MWMQSLRNVAFVAAEGQVVRREVVSLGSGGHVPVRVVCSIRENHSVEGNLKNTLLDTLNNKRGKLIFHQKQKQIFRK